MQTFCISTKIDAQKSYKNCIPEECLQLKAMSLLIFKAVH